MSQTFDSKETQVLRVQNIKSISGIELGSPCKPLLDEFNTFLNFELNPPCLDEQIPSLMTKVANWWNGLMNEMRWASTQHVIISWVSWDKGIAEIRIQQPSVRIEVIPPHKCGNIISMAKQSMLL